MRMQHLQNAVINFKYLHPHYIITIRIRAIIVFIKCGYYPLSAYEVLNDLDYYLIYMQD